MIKKLSAAVLCLVLTALCACGKTAKTANLDEVFTSFNLDPNVVFEYTAEEAEFFYGIDAADVKQLRAATSLTGLDCDEIVLVEAVSSEAASRIEAKLNTRLENKKNETQSYLPQEYAVIITCTVEKSGSFVSMIVCDNAKELTKIYKDSFK